MLEIGSLSGADNARYLETNERSHDDYKDTPTASRASTRQRETCQGDQVLCGLPAEAVCDPPSSAGIGTPSGLGLCQLVLYWQLRGYAEQKGGASG